MINIVVATNGLTVPLRIDNRSRESVEKDVFLKYEEILFGGVVGRGPRSLWPCYYELDGERIYGSAPVSTLELEDQDRIECVLRGDKDAADIAACLAESAIASGVVSDARTFAERALVCGMWPKEPRMKAVLDWIANQDKTQPRAAVLWCIKLLTAEFYRGDYVPSEDSAMRSKASSGGALTRNADGILQGEQPSPASGSLGDSRALGAAPAQDGAPNPSPPFDRGPKAGGVPSAPRVSSDTATAAGVPPPKRRSVVASMEHVVGSVGGGGGGDAASSDGGRRGVPAGTKMPGAGTVERTINGKLFFEMVTSQGIIRYVLEFV